jgi:flagellar hook-length control protein FliK
MMATLPTTPTATNPTAAATASVADQSNAATDFLTMLGQMAESQTVAAAMVPLLLANGHEQPNAEQLEAHEFEYAWLPFALPTMTQQAQLDAAGLQASGGVSGVQLVTGKTATLEAELVTEMIEAEQALARESVELEGFRLPANVESAQAVKPPVHDPIARSVQAPVGTQAWADELGTRMTMMVEGGRSTASLRMSPEHLGPVEVRIAVQDDKATVWFGAAHADTRAALEQALPRLRELFAAQGMSLTDAGVFQQAPREQATAASEIRGSIETDGPAEERAPANAVSVGLLDMYA